jgi:hypothetical protein
MPRKAKRIVRTLVQFTENMSERHHPIYYEVIASRMSSINQTFHTWLDILSEDIKHIIWKQYYQNVTIPQIHEFRQYQSIVRIFIKNHLNCKFYDDMAFTRDGKLMVRKLTTDYDQIETEYNPQIMWFTNDMCNLNYNTITGFFGMFDYTGLVSGIFHETNISPFNRNIVRDIETLYGLCKTTPDNWDYIGRFDETGASRFTKIN